MKLNTIQSKSFGFSLIEVLIAVLVLATGMLALAALQSALIRNSVDAKNRSIAQGFAISKLEHLREEVTATDARYEALDLVDAGGDWHPASERLIVVVDGEDAYVSETGAAGETAPGSGNASFATEFEWRPVVTRFIRESESARCGTNEVPCFRPYDAAIDDETAQSGVAEFKRIDLQVKWDDAQGNERIVTTSDIVGTVTDEKTGLILDQTGLPSAGVGAPVARIDRPSEAGIIPIAFGDNQETAASNPKPVTGRERGRTDETQFQVYTYSLSGSTATLNRVVDVRVLGCRCTLRSASSVVDKNTVVGTPVQPTFWDGNEYTEPRVVGNLSEGLRGEAQLGAAQNEELCTSCCLDHHDRSTNAVKFDSLRRDASGDAEWPHKHFFDPNESDSAIEFSEAGEGDNYLESCRFVRVNGIFRVATDTRLEMMNLLETDPAYPDDSVPLQSAAGRYADAVKDYVDAKVVDGTADPTDTVQANYPEIFALPDFLLSRTDQQYQHNRGLYLDVLEQPALDVLAEARSNCADSDVLNCLLPHIPVLALNTTELAQWTTQFSSGSSDAVTVTNYALSPGCKKPPCLVEPQPARGVVTAVADGSEQTYAKQYRSNTGVADTYPIDAQDAAQGSGNEHEQLPDNRNSVVGSSGGGCGTVLSTFTVYPTSTSGDFSVASVSPRWDDMSSTSTCPREAGATCTTDATPPPYYCQMGVELPRDVRLRVSGYNRDTGRQIQIANSCAGKGKVKVSECANFAISSITINGVPHGAPTTSDYDNEGKVGEFVNLYLPASRMDPDARVDVVFGNPVLTAAPLVCSGTAIVSTACP